MTSPLNNRFLEVEQNTSPAVLILLDAAGAPVAFNRAARQLIHILDGIQWEGILHPEETKSWRDLIRLSLDKQVSVSGWFRLRRFDNAFRQFVLRAEPRFDHNGDFFGHHVSGLDVTEIATGVQTGNSNVPVEPASAKDDKQPDYRSVAKQWHDALVTEATVINVSTDVLLELIKDQPDNSELIDITLRARRSAVAICDQLKVLNQFSREA